jgi:hypothetical protein
MTAEKIIISVKLKVIFFAKKKWMNRKIEKNITT